MEQLYVGGRFLDVVLNVFKQVDLKTLIKRCETMWKSVGSAQGLRRT